jgi:hypothetical protein
MQRKIEEQWKSPGTYKVLKRTILEKLRKKLS